LRWEVLCSRQLKLASRSIAHVRHPPPNTYRLLKNSFNCSSHATALNCQSNYSKMKSVVPSSLKFCGISSYPCGRLVFL
jgi:hypothetical protein